VFKKPVALLISLILLAVPLLGLAGLGCAKGPPRLLLIYSYNPEYAWVADEDRGVAAVFQGKGYSVEKFYLDTKRQTSPEWFQQVAAAADQKIAEYKPDLVMVFDDNACNLVAKKYAGKDLPFVFTGMNSDPAIYGFPAKNVTGVLERYDVTGAVDLLKKIAPSVKRAAVLTDDSVTSQGIINDIKATNPSLTMSYYTINDFEEWKATLNKLQTEVDAIGLFQYHTLTDQSQGISLSPQEVIAWTRANNRLPEFTFFDFAVNDGVLCGRVSSGYEQGKAGAAIAVRILAGENPADIAIEKPIQGISMINQTRAGELHLTIPAEVQSSATVVQ
jgi:ABC-type uncharacterized transport system substrate-binding protein